MKSILIPAVVCIACSSSASAPSSSDAGSNDAADASIVTPYQGVIEVIQGRSVRENTTEAGYHNGDAMFYPTVRDTSITTGPCKLFPNYSTTSPTYLDAGTVGITDGLAPLDFQQLSALTTPPGNGEYIVPIGNGRFTALWAGGQMLTANIGGTSMVPAAQLTVAAPTQVTITSPEIYPGITIDRSRDLQLTWTGGAAKDQLVLLFSMQGPNGPTDTSPRLFCEWDSAPGHGAIPASALGMLPAGGAIVEGWNEANLDVVKGDWHFYFTAAFNAIATCPSCSDSVREVAADVAIQ